MRWIVVLSGLALALAASLGCKQQCFMSADDFNHYQDLGVANLEHDATPAIVASTSDIAAPTTVLEPEREIRFITLSEAIAIALEQGTVGIQNFFISLNRSNLNNYTNDNLITFNGAPILRASDNIRVLALQPAVAASNIEAALSKFDARWLSSATWNTTDQPVANAIQTIQALGQAVIVQDNAAVNTGVIKPLPTGGVAGITLSNAYQLSNLRQRLNPSYQPNLTFSFEQPLLQGYGVEMNQLRTTHPGSILNPFSTASRVEGILITRIRFDQERAEFERNLNYMLGNVELAYWELYGAYWSLYTQEAGLRFAYETWRLNKQRYDAGRIAELELAQSRVQYETFRGGRLQAMADVLERERQVRGMLGLPVEDGTRLVPVDTPTLAPYRPDWQTAVNEALANRPELIIARNNLKDRQLDLIAQKNQLMPDLRFISQYALVGIGNRLDGSDGNALRSMASNDFHTWNFGLQMSVPIGFRDANAAVRASRLYLAQSYALLKDQENKAIRFLANSYRTVFENYEQIRIQRARREAAAIQLARRSSRYVAGQETLEFLLQAQREWADALKAEYDNVVLYNKSLVGFEFAKGTLLSRDNVIVSEGPLPVCAQVRAVEHERQRGKALVLRERARAEGRSCQACGLSLPSINGGEAPSLPSLPELPALFQDKPALPEIAPKQLIAPKPTEEQAPSGEQPASSALEALEKKLVPAERPEPSSDPEAPKALPVVVPPSTEPAKAYDKPASAQESVTPDVTAPVETSSPEPPPVSPEKKHKSAPWEDAEQP